ncbi:hypothetical protein V8D89_007645 [Ganoderma adspersum]
MLYYLFALAFLVASAFAQRCQITAPAEWSTVKPGSNVTVELDRPMTLSSSQEVAIAIGFWPCNGPCNRTDVTEVMGSLVYSGPYNPQLNTTANWRPPYQNFTVTVPAHFTPGSEVSLNVAHFSLIGAGLMPFLETLNITLKIGS